MYVIFVYIIMGTLWISMTCMVYINPSNFCGSNMPIVCVHNIILNGGQLIWFM